MRVLVTGGAGFLGKRVVEAMVARGHHVSVLVRPSRRLETAGSAVDFVRGDLRVPSTLRDALTGVEAVVHLAATVVGDEESQFQNTVVGTENLLAAMGESGVRRLVHCSSFSVYDWAKAGRRLDESTPLETSHLYRRDGYAIAKTWQERVVRRWAEANGAALTVLRPGFIWGPGMERVSAFGMPIGPLDVVVGPFRELPITYVENCAEAFAMAVDQPSAVGETFNVVDDERVSAWRFTAESRRRLGVRAFGVPLPYTVLMATGYAATAVSRTLFPSGGKLPGILMPNRCRARFGPLRFPNDRLKRVLGWKPRYDFSGSWARCVEANDGSASTSRTPDSVADREVEPIDRPTPAAEGDACPATPAGEASHA